MAIRDYVGTQQSQSLASGGFVPTQPGDPNFSAASNPNSQAQLPAAYVERQQAELKTQAQNLLGDAAMQGYDITDPAYNDLNQVAAQGFAERALTMGEKMIGLIDGPRQFVNMFLQSMADPGKNNLSVGDWADALWLGVDDPLEFEARTGLNPVSGSKTLELFGIDEANTWYGKVGRGIADFGLQMLTDPLTYVTFGMSGLGKKVAKEAAEETTRKLTRNIMRKRLDDGNFDLEELSDYERLVVNRLEDDKELLLQKMADDPLAEAAVNEHLAKKLGIENLNDVDDENLYGALIENLDELAIESRITEDTLMPLMNRDFGALPEEILEHLPAYARGGARIGIPFTKNQLSRGVMIPGTRGMGRKVVGNHVRAVSEHLKQFAPYQKIADNLGAVATAFDRQRPLLKMLADSNIPGWQYNILNSQADNLDIVAKTGVFHAQINDAAQTLFKLADEAGESDQSKLLSAVFARANGHEIDLTDPITGEAQVLAGRTEEYMGAIEEAAKVMKLISAEFRTELEKFNPALANHLENTVPHVLGGDGIKIVSELAQKANFISRERALAMHADGNPAGIILLELIEAVGHGGATEARLGSILGAGGERVGRTTMVPILDNGAINIDIEVLTGWGQAAEGVLGDAGSVNVRALPRTNQISAHEMNTLLAPLIKQLAEEKGIHLPKGWRGAVFNENPFEVMSTYVENMSTSLQMWNTINALKSAGLATTKRSVRSTHDIIKTIAENVRRNSERVTELVTREMGEDISPASVEAPVKWLKEQVAEPENKNRVLREALIDTPNVNLGDGPVGAPPKYGDPENVRGYVVGEGGVVEQVSIRRPEVGGYRSHHEAMTGSGLIDFNEAEGMLDRAQYVASIGQGRLATVDYIPINVETPMRVTANWDSLGQQQKDEIIAIAKERGQHGIDVSDLEGNEWKIPIEPSAPPGTTSNRVGTLRDLTQQIIDEGYDPNQPIRIGVNDQKRAYIIDGHHRLQAAEDAGLERVPVEWVYEDDTGMPFSEGFEGFDVSGSLSADPAQRLPKLSETGFPGSPIAHGVRDIEGVFDSVPWNPKKTITEERLGARVMKGVRDARSAARNRTRVAMAGVRALGMDPDDVAGNKQLWELTQLNSTEFNALRPMNAGRSAPSLFRNERNGLRVLAERAPSAARRNSARTVLQASEGTDPARVGMKYSGEVVDGDGNVTHWHTYRDDQGVPIGDLRITRNTDGSIKTIDWGYNPAAEGGGREMDFISAMEDFLRQDLAERGGFNYNNIMNLLASTPMTDHSMIFMRRFIRNTFGLLDDKTLEAVSGGIPSELVRFQGHLEEFSEVMNKLLAGHGKLFNPETGEIIGALPNQGFKYVADEEFDDLLARAKALAELTEVDSLQRIFKDVERDTKLLDYEGFVNPKLFGLGGPAARDLVMQKDMAAWVRNMAANASTIYTPHGIASLHQGLRGAMRAWKGLATVARPTFHIRNAIGGAWNNQIIGVRTSDYVRVGRNGRKFREALKAGNLDKAIEAVDPDMQDTFRAAWEQGVLSGFATTEFRKYSYAETSKALDMLNPFDPDNFALTKMGGGVMETIEDFMRMSAFARWYDPADPGTAKVAREMANAAQFDYNALTPWETKVKEIIPFFVWIRRNLPRQLEVMAENPKIIQRYRNMMQSMNDNFGTNPEDEENNMPGNDLMTAFAADTGMKVNPDTPFWARIMIDPDLPVSDIVNLPNPNLPNMAEFGMDLMGPHITGLYDIMTQREYGNINAPASFEAVAKSLSFIGLYDSTTEGDVRIPYWLRTVAETALPFTREVTEPFFGGPNDPSRQASRGIAQDEGFLSSAIKSLGFGLARGAGVELQGPTDANRAIGRSRTEMMDMASEMRLAGVLPPNQN